MDKIIDFIFKNWFFVLIIISVVSSFLGKLNKVDPSASGKPPMKDMPSFGGKSVPTQTRHDDVEDEEAYRESHLRTEEELAPSVPSMDGDNVFRTSMSTRRSTENREGPKTAFGMTVKPKSNVSSASLSASKKSSKLAVTPKDMTQAIIWSEILGPPRSKKPNIR